MCIYMRLWLIYMQFSVPQCLGSCLLWGAQPSATKLNTEYKCRNRQLWHFSSQMFLGESKGSCCAVGSRAQKLFAGAVCAQRSQINSPPKYSHPTGTESGASQMDSGGKSVKCMVE